MSRLNDLLRQLRAKEPALARDLEREVAALADRRAFGLNFERHVPEAVELPGPQGSKGDKVRDPASSRPGREAADDGCGVSSGSTARPRTGSVAGAASTGAPRRSQRRSLQRSTTWSSSPSSATRSTRASSRPGKVERGGDKPFHTVINAENFHALETLLFTHRGKVDAIYIDPPYNTGAKDWKYNNDYVEADDLYRHSKWLAFMERRLLHREGAAEP